MAFFNNMREDQFKSQSIPKGLLNMLHRLECYCIAGLSWLQSFTFLQLLLNCLSKCLHNFLVCWVGDGQVWVKGFLLKIIYILSIKQWKYLIYNRYGVYMSRWYGTHTMIGRIMMVDRCSLALSLYQSKLWLLEVL